MSTQLLQHPRQQCSRHHLQQMGTAVSVALHNHLISDVSIVTELATLVALTSSFAAKRNSYISSIAQSLTQLHQQHSLHHLQGMGTATSVALHSHLISDVGSIAQSLNQLKQQSNQLHWQHTKPATLVAFKIRFVGSTQKLAPLFCLFFSPRSNSLFGVLRSGNYTTTAQVAVDLQCWSLKLKQSSIMWLCKQHLKIGSISNTNQHCQQHLNQICGIDGIQHSKYQLHQQHSRSATLVALESSTVEPHLPGSN